ncbi:RNA polymerase sigma factor [Cohnella caldifontis]|uniref:RNA polymerase sigma factor n=1 Tax=Cohnella caldifontis TaxID=3027471 RepID=UPI0023ECE462|nr:sigma-70 family RNA polymerase sigma factor [Cohnella sp. YIM B05605]
MDWESVWKDHWLEIYRYIYFKVGGRQEAEDLTQETFIRLIRSGKDYGDAPIVGLLKRTAMRLIIDRWRSDKSRARTVGMDDRVLGDEGSGNPESRYIRNEQIRQALDVLNDDQRLIVRLRLIQGYSVKETAELTGRTETSVRTLQFRAIRSIQQALGIQADEGVIRT